MYNVYISIHAHIYIYNNMYLYKYIHTYKYIHIHTVYIHTVYIHTVYTRKKIHMRISASLNTHTHIFFFYAAADRGGGLRTYWPTGKTSGNFMTNGETRY